MILKLFAVSAFLYFLGESNSASIRNKERFILSSPSIHFDTKKIVATQGEETTSKVGDPKAGNENSLDIHEEPLKNDDSTFRTESPVKYESDSITLVDSIRTAVEEPKNPNGSPKARIVEKGFAERNYYHPGNTQGFLEEILIHLDSDSLSRPVFSIRVPLVEPSKQPGSDDRDDDVLAPNGFWQHPDLSSTLLRGKRETEEEERPEMKLPVSAGQAVVALSKLQKLLDKMMKELYSRAKKFTVRLIRINSPSELAEVGEFIKDLNVTDASPLFLVVGGIKKQGYIEEPEENPPTPLPPHGSELNPPPPSPEESATMKEYKFEDSITESTTIDAEQIFFVEPRVEDQVELETTTILSEEHELKNEKGSDVISKRNERSLRKFPEFENPKSRIVGKLSPFQRKSPGAIFPRQNRGMRFWGQQVEGIDPIKDFPQFSSHSIINLGGGKRDFFEGRTARTENPFDDFYDENMKESFNETPSLIPLIEPTNWEKEIRNSGGKDIGTLGSSEPGHVFGHEGPKNIKVEMAFSHQDVATDSPPISNTHLPEEKEMLIKWEEKLNSPPTSPIQGSNEMKEISSASEDSEEGLMGFQKNDPMGKSAEGFSILSLFRPSTSQETDTGNQGLHVDPKVHELLLSGGPQLVENQQVNFHSEDYKGEGGNMEIPLLSIPIHNPGDDEAEEEKSSSESLKTNPASHEAQLALAFDEIPLSLEGSQSPVPALTFHKVENEKVTLPVQPNEPIVKGEEPIGSKEEEDKIEPSGPLHELVPNVSSLPLTIVPNAAKNNSSSALSLENDGPVGAKDVEIISAAENDISLQGKFPISLLGPNDTAEKLGSEAETVNKPTGTHLPFQPVNQDEIRGPQEGIEGAISNQGQTNLSPLHQLPSIENEKVGSVGVSSIGENNNAPLKEMGMENQESIIMKLPQVNLSETTKKKNKRLPAFIASYFSFLKKNPSKENLDLPMIIRQKKIKSLQTTY